MVVGRWQDYGGDELEGEIELWIDDALCIWLFIYNE
jgi:hypothetical protein